KDRALPTKESGLFRQLLQHYEAKQHKQGIKAADQILKKFPNHGETLAIKALVIHSSLPHNHPTATSQPKGEEANRLIDTALRKDPYSHITHHVHSIILRADKDFAGAADALRKAREIDPENIPLIRDSISLYTQLKHYDEAQQARIKYHTLRPNMKANWVTVAIGYELCGEPQNALNVYDQLGKALKDTGYDSVEKAELCIHTIRLMVEVGRYQDALELLRKSVDDKTLPPICDVMTLEATIYEKLGQKEKAEEQYRKLIELNPDNLSYYGNLMFLKGIDFDSTISEDLLPKTLTIMDGFAESYPRASAPKRLILDIVNGDEFRSRVKAYMQKAFEKGVPSLFSDLKELCRAEEKQKIIQEAAEEFREHYEAKDESEPYSEALLWTYYFIASSISHRTCPQKDYARALELLDIAGKRHPTVPEVLFARGHVLKRAGDLEGAARALEQARLLDKSDRFLNGKAGKYWLRAGQIEKAGQVFGLFTKKDAPTPGADLKDMQCSWYLIEEGDAYRRAGNLPLAVKRYEQVIAIYQELEDDEYDFHTYSLRKLTLDAYQQMMKFDRELRSDRWFTRAAASACEVYALIHDDPSLREIRLSPEEEAERKKAAKKAQKAGSKAKKAAASAPTDPKKEKEEPSLPDSDPAGADYLKEVDPLEAMERLVQAMRRTPTLESWLVEFELAMRKKQFMRMRLAMSHAHDLAPDHPKVHEKCIALAIFCRSEAGVKALAEGQKEINEVALAEIEKFIPQDASALRTNSDYLQQHQDAGHILAAARSLYLILSNQLGEGQSELSGDDKRQVEETLMQIVSPDVQPDLAVYKQALAFYVSPLKSSDEARSAFLSAVRKNLPLGFDFKELSEIASRREAWAKEDDSVATNGDSKK
ncbi:NMDA receptor-regulated protein 1-domain-containing protein, partial [Filobasidium floriforme]|uniref:NMDA receptor-regulated protein 1-domain-containing protein n=1 Tax=Filobasidium floriforme TaxID=5210 RepID=UPI001E8E6786